jgi:hypothetical protein
MSDVSTAEALLPVVSAASAIGGAYVGGRQARRAATEAERQRQAFAERAERRERRRGGRLVADELQRNAAELEGALRTPDWQWPPRPGFRLDREVWETHRAALADSEVDDDLWDALTAAYFEVQLVNGAAQDPAGREAEASGRTYLRDAHARTLRAAGLVDEWTRSLDG